MDFTIAICTYNRGNYLKDTLRDVAALSYPKERFEVLIINNKSTDNTENIALEAIQTYSDVNFTLIHEHQQGLSHARNRAIAEATSENVVFIDDDVFLPTDFLEKWRRFLSEFPSVEMAGGAVDIHVDGKIPNWFPMVLKQILGEHHPYSTPKPYTSGGFPIGCNMLLRKRAGVKTGGFNTSIGRTGNQLLAGEEKDLAERIRKTGGMIAYNPYAQLKHRIGEERLTKDYIHRQANGVGLGDRLRQKSIFESINWIVLQGIKLFISISISLIYLVTFRPGKGSMVLQFRWWVLEGFFSINKNSNKFTTP